MGVAGMAVISCDGALPRVRPSEGWLLIDGWGGVPVGFEKRVRLSRPGQAGSSDGESRGGDFPLSSQWWQVRIRASLEILA